MRGRSPVGPWVFLVVGLGLLAGACWWTYAGVYQPMTWPRTDGEVVSSRIINPRAPNQYVAELVFRYDAAGSSREPTVIPSWSSGSYDLVRRFTDRYPPGQRLPLGVNPANPDDVAYELNWTFDVMLGPLVLSLLGTIFGGIGLLLVRGLRPRAGGTSAPLNPLRFVSPVFFAVGAGILLIGVLMFRSDAAMRSSWGTVTAEVVSSEVVRGGSGNIGGRSRNNPAFNARVLFRYSVNGRAYQNATTYGFMTSSGDFARDLTTTFSTGTRHDIRFRPDDPNIIRFDLDSWWSTFGLSASMIAMGVIFIGFGVMARLLLASVTRTFAAARGGGGLSQ